MSILEEEHFDPYHRLVNVKQDEYKGEFMRQALQRLPIFERTCFLLQIEGEFALEDVAEIMSESQERVASALCKAREHARQYYHELVRQEQQEAGPEKAVRHPLYVFSSLSQWIQGATEGRFWTFRAKPQPMSAFRQRPVSVLGTSRLVLIIAVVMLALLLNPFSMGHVAKADTLSLSMPSKSQTIYKLAWAHTVAWSTNGEDIATLWSDNTMQVWNARTGLESFHVNDIGWGAGLAFSPNDGKYLASVATDTTFQVFDVVTCKAQPDACQPLWSYQGHEGPIKALSWSPDGTKIASASSDGTVRIWDVETTKVLLVYRDDHTPRVKLTAVAWSPDGKRIVSGDDGGQVQIWDALTGHLLLLLEEQRGLDPVTFVSWSHDSRSLASSGYKGIVHIWDAQTGQTIASIPSTENGSVESSENDPIYAVVWSHRSSLIALASYDTIQVWDLSTGKPQQLGHSYHPSDHASDEQFAHAPGKGEANMFTVAWSPDDRQIVCGGQGYTLGLSFHG